MLAATCGATALAIASMTLETGGVKKSPSASAAARVVARAALGRLDRVQA